MPFTCKLPNSETTYQPPPLKCCHTLGHYPAALITSGLGTRLLGTVPTSQSPLKLFKLASPEAAYPALLVPSCGNHNKGSCPHFLLVPSFWVTLVLPHVALHGVACPLLLGPVIITNYRFSGNYCLLIYWHDILNNNKTYILKHSFIVKILFIINIKRETMIRSQYIIYNIC